MLFNTEIFPWWINYWDTYFQKKPCNTIPEHVCWRSTEYNVEILLQEPAPEPAEGGAVGGQWTNTRLPDGVRALTRALSELLADIRFMPHPVENGGAQADRAEEAENHNEPEDQYEENDWD